VEKALSSSETSVLTQPHVVTSEPPWKPQILYTDVVPICHWICFSKTTSHYKHIKSFLQPASAILDQLLLCQRPSACLISTVCLISLDHFYLSLERTCQSQSQSYLTTDGLSASLFWYLEPATSLRSSSMELVFKHLRFHFILGRPFWREVRSIDFQWETAREPRNVRVKELSYDRRSFGQSVLVSSHRLRPANNFFISCMETIFKHFGVALVSGALSDKKMGVQLLVKLLLSIVNAVTLGSKSRRTWDHILLSHLRLGSLLSPLTTRMFTGLVWEWTILLLFYLGSYGYIAKKPPSSAFLFLFYIRLVSEEGSQQEALFAVRPGHILAASWQDMFLRNVGLMLEENILNH
jgi:hypothetical protein